MLFMQKLEGDTSKHKINSSYISKYPLLKNNI